MSTAGALRLGIFCALADYQPLRMNSLRSDRCFTAEAARKKSSKPRETRRPHPPFPSAGSSRRKWGVCGGNKGRIGSGSNSWGVGQGRGCDNLAGGGWWFEGFQGSWLVRYR